MQYDLLSWRTVPGGYAKIRHFFGVTFYAFLSSNIIAQWLCPKRSILFIAQFQDFNGHHGSVIPQTGSICY